MPRTSKYPPPTALTRHHDRSSFDCGVSELNDYLQRFALQNQRKDLARTYITADSGERVIGFYTLVYGSVEVADVPADVSAGTGRYPIPILLLARLGVDIREKGTGQGGILVRDALERTLQAADIAGLRAVMIHAKEDTVAAFYKAYGFRPSPSEELTLFLKTSEIRKNFRSR